MAHIIRLDHPLPLDRLPTSRLVRHRAPALGHVLLAALMLGFSAALLGGRGDRPLQIQDELLLVGLGAATLGFLLRAAIVWTGRRTLLVDAVTVTSRAQNCMRRSEWSEPLASYRGVLVRERILAGPGASPIVVHQARLVHSVDSRGVDLFASSDAAAVREYREKACRTLGVPALTVGMNGLVSADPEPTECGASAQPSPVLGGLLEIPSELRCDANQGAIGVTIDRCEMRWYSFPIIAGFPLALHWVCTRSPMPPVMNWIVSAVTVLIAMFLVGVFTLDRIGRRRIELHDDHADYFLRTPFGDLLHSRIDLRDLGSAIIRRDQRGRPELAIEARDRQLEIGNGLSWESLEWLRTMLLRRAATGQVETCSEVAVGPV